MVVDENSYCIDNIDIIILLRCCYYSIVNSKIGFLGNLPQVLSMVLSIVCELYALKF